MKDKVYCAILDYITEHGYPPTIEEIRGMVGIGSKSTVKKHLGKLGMDGKIKLKKGSPRAIRLLEYDVELRPRVKVEEGNHEDI